ncbi:tyrosine-type recombinase/integrase [Parabacteroides gordonii]
MPALYRILYATGIRIGEAISIRNRDVDLRRNCIIIRRQKNKMERLIL